MDMETIVGIVTSSLNGADFSSICGNECNTDILNIMAKEFDIRDLSFGVVVKGDSKYILVQFSNDDGYISKGTYKIAEIDIMSEISDLIYKIVRGSEAIAILNKAIRNIQQEQGNPLNIMYIWGNSDKCSVSYWDYNNIKIRISNTVLNNILSKIDSNGTEGLLELTVGGAWESNIIKFIRNSDRFGLHNKLGVNFKTYNIGDILTYNMLSMQDVIGIIGKNSNLSGVQKFKSVIRINELGKFLALVVWDVDYKNKTIKTRIMGEKAIDIEGSRFISDHNLYSRIEARALISDEIIDSIFNK